MTSIHSLKTLELPIPPSCVAFSPATTQYFIVGTYLLERDEDAEANKTADPAAQKRSGSLILFRLVEDEM